MPGKQLNSVRSERCQVMTWPDLLSTVNVIITLLRLGLVISQINLISHSHVVIIDLQSDNRHTYDQNSNNNNDSIHFNSHNKQSCTQSHRVMTTWYTVAVEYRTD